MDKQRKSELAEVDERWSFEKTVGIPETSHGDEWQHLKGLYNSLQEEQGDLYMRISSLPRPSRLDRLKVWGRDKTSSFNGEVTFHHSQVYNWFLKLAVYLDTGIGEAVQKVYNDIEGLREMFELGETMNVDIGHVDSMDTGDSKVSKDQLQQMIDK